MKSLIETYRKLNEGPQLGQNEGFTHKDGESYSADAHKKSVAAHLDNFADDHAEASEAHRRAALVHHGLADKADDTGHQGRYEYHSAVAKHHEQLQALHQKHQKTGNPDQFKK